MTTAGIHPSEIAEKLAARRAAMLSAWGFGALSLLALSLQGVSNIARDRALLCGSAVALGIAAQYQRGHARRMSGQLQDIDDISNDAYQSFLYRQMQPAAGRLEVSATAEVMPLFDWAELADPDEHPTLAIISPMGGGKSRLARYLASHILFPGDTPEIRALDIYGRPQDWQGATLITDHPAMLEMMTADLEAIGQRVGQYRQGREQFQPLFWVLEEAPDTLGTLTQVRANIPTITAWVTKATTVARKVRCRLCLVSVRLSGAEIGISAEARNDATVIFPGRKGIAKAMADDRIFKLGSKQNRELRERLKSTLATLPRPALIYTGGQWHPASIPELDASGDPIGHGRKHPPDRAPSSQAEVEGLPSWQSLEALYQQGQSALSSQAEKLSAYLTRKGEISLRDLGKNWARNNGLTSAELIDLVNELEQHGSIAVSGDIVKWMEN